MLTTCCRSFDQRCSFLKYYLGGKNLISCYKTIEVLKYKNTHSSEDAYTHIQPRPHTDSHIHAQKIVHIGCNQRESKKEKSKGITRKRGNGECKKSGLSLHGLTSILFPGRFFPFLFLLFTPSLPTHHVPLRHSAPDHPPTSSHFWRESGASQTLPARHLLAYF